MKGGTDGRGTCTLTTDGLDEWAGRQVDTHDTYGMDGFTITITLDVFFLYILYL